MRKNQKKERELILLQLDVHIAAARSYTEVPMVFIRITVVGSCFTYVLIILSVMPMSELIQAPECRLELWQITNSEC